MPINIPGNLPPSSPSPENSAVKLDGISSTPSNLNSLLGSVKTLQAGNARVVGLAGQIATQSASSKLFQAQSKANNPDPTNLNNQAGSINSIPTSTQAETSPKVLIKQSGLKQAELAKESPTHSLDSLSPKQFKNIKLESFYLSNLVPSRVLVDKGKPVQSGVTIVKEDLSPSSLKLASLSFKLESTKPPEVIAKGIVIKDSGDISESEQPLRLPVFSQSSAVNQKVLMQSQEKDSSFLTQPQLLSTELLPSLNSESIATPKDLEILSNTTLSNKETTVKPNSTEKELKISDISSALKKIDESKKNLEFVAEYQDGENGRHNQKGNQERKEQNEEKDEKKKTGSQTKDRIINLQIFDSSSVYDNGVLREREAFERLNHAATKIGQLVAEFGSNLSPEAVKTIKGELEIAVNGLSEVIDEDMAERDFPQVKANFEEKVKKLEQLEFANVFGIEPLEEETRSLSDFVFNIDVSLGIFQKDITGNILYDNYGRPLMKVTIFGKSEGRAPNPAEVQDANNTPQFVQYQIAEGLYRTLLDLVTNQLSGAISRNMTLLSTLTAIIADIWARLKNSGSS